MKKLTGICIVVALVLNLLTGCAPKMEQAEPQVTKSVEQEVTQTTLMIYMVGSDLEAKTGAATTDLEEIAASGIDLSCNRVVVCAGGSPYWVNETVQPDQLNILTLQEQGFAVVDTLESGSMGVPQQLQNFLTYCHTNYAGDEFALVLWDHGNGPVMGYGKDILFANDALQLVEIRQALENSPFGQTEKLSWIGFDACLMASAELSCLLADYADYLIASQEVEPAFGWDYSFLSQLGKADTAKLLSLATENYLAACEDYYTQRNYSNYDVTLSVVDLSLAKELDQAINDLFSQAEVEVAHYYDLLAKKRIESMALGRATTGSEYDLVDLQDMASRLSSQYPQQSAVLQDVIDRMVVVNATSMDKCCGMSLYYPFYNKRYYEKDWKRIYEELNIFPEYLDYLTGYEEIWLREDEIGQNVMGLTPEQTAKNSYSVTLTPEQAASYASGQFHVLRRREGDVYQRVFNSQDVIWDGSTLTANYDGMAIYVNTGDGQHFNLALSEVDQIERLSRYRGRCALSNMAYQPEDLTDEELPEEVMSNWRYLLTLNRETGKVEMSGSVPYEESDVEELLESGRKEDAPFSSYGMIEFIDDPNLYITRYKNGAIKPLSQWYNTRIYTGRAVFTSMNYSFTYEPLANGEYYLTFEITDTQSEGYCTELLPIIVDNDLPAAEKAPPVSCVKWQPGESRVLLTEKDDIRVYLTTQDTERNGTRYFVDVENFGEDTVKLSVEGDILLNGTIHVESNVSLRIRPNDFMYEELSFGLAETTNVLKNLETLQFTINLVNNRSGRTLWPEQTFLVDMSQAPSADMESSYRTTLCFDYPFMGAIAQEQILCETEQMRLTLLGVGSAVENNTRTSCDFYFRAENLSDKDSNISLEGIVINGQFFELYGDDSVSAGKEKYFSAWFDGSTLKNQKTTGIHSLEFLVSISEEDQTWFREMPRMWCPVTLQQAADPQSGLSGKLLWEEQGVRLSLLEFDPQGGQWLLLVENNTDQDISLNAVDASYDGIPSGSGWSIYLYEGALGAGQTTVCSVRIFDVGDDDLTSVPKEISFRPQVRSFYETQVLFTSDETITLSVQ